jgi:hypothetical protein
MFKTADEAREWFVEHDRKAWHSNQVTTEKPIPEQCRRMPATGGTFDVATFSRKSY